MSEPQPPSPSERDPKRWQLLLQRSAEPLFLLNQQRRVLEINAACEAYFGLAAETVRGLACHARPTATAPAAWLPLAAALAPPPEVAEGRPARVRRSVARPGQPVEWWDIDFLPLHDARGRLRTLGKITRALVETAPDAVPLPTTLAALRERCDRDFGLDGWESAAPALRRVVNQARLAAESRVPVLLLGEPGSGKTWLARTIHLLGPQRQRHFARVDGALPAALLDSALFGPGGLLANASVGTIYVADIPAVPRELQDRLNDWLTAPPANGPRLVVGCSPPLETGRLLEALQCAVSTLVIALPPLRERLADLPRLAERLLAQSEMAPKPALSAAALQACHAYAWPGNLRELREVVEGAGQRAKSDRIEPGDLPLKVRLAAGLEPAPAPARPLDLDKILQEVERRLIGLALRKARGNKSRAAELLSVWRPRLLRRLEALGLGGSEAAS